MAEPVIRLDRSRPFSECRGERQPDDPHYRVHFWQGQPVGKNMVLLPFDSSGELVPDDGKTAPYQGLVDGKPVTHHPLYTQAMRDLVDRKKSRQKAVEAPEGDGADAGEGDSGVGKKSLLDEVNFVAWLRGEARYEWPLLQVAAKDRYARVYTSKRELVTDLVLDEKIVPEDQVCEAFAELLPEKAA